jgi:hypothetical protein
VLASSSARFRGAKAYRDLARGLLDGTATSSHDLIGAAQ